MPRKPKQKEESIAEAALAEKSPVKPKRQVSRRYKRKYIDRIADEPPKVEAKPEKKGKDDLSKLTTDGDLVDIWERRLLNPDHQESLPIRIKTPGMKLRWINLSHRGRFQRARYEQGWVPVHRNELTEEREISGVSYTSEGYVCRGERQGEMLMKIPQVVWNKIQKRRSELTNLSYKKLREQMGSAGYAHFKDKYGGSAGDIAAEAAGSFVGQVKFGVEKERSDEMFE